MMTKDSYNDLRDRVTKFGNDYFDNKGEALLKEMEDFISGDSKEFEEDIIENVLKSNLYSEKIKKEAEEILNDATSAKGDMVDIHKMIGAFFPLGDTFVQDEEAQPTWEKVASKPVQDSDGFWTEYTWYKNADGHHIMIFGDTDLYTPENSSADAEFESEQEAKEWFDDYEGFEDDDFNALEDYTDELWAYYDNTPNGVLNLDDSCATEDSSANDTFVQDEVEDPNDKREVILYNKWKIISNSLEAMKNELAKHNLTAEDLKKPENKELKELYNRYRNMSKTFQKVDAMLNNYRKQRGSSLSITDDDANAPKDEAQETKEKEALKYIANSIKGSRIGNHCVIQTIELDGDDFDWDGDYREEYDDHYELKDSAIEEKIESYTEDIVGEYLDEDTDLGFDFEVESDADYNSDVYITFGRYYPATYWEPAEQDSDEGGSVEINIYYSVTIK